MQDRWSVASTTVMLKSISSTLLTSALTLTLSFQASAKISGEELAKRQCRSVHLGYQKVVDDAAAAYVEVAVTESAPGTYFCALGFSKGYLGMQELASGKKVMIFSVWEPNHGQNAKNVPEDQRAKLIRKGEGVRTARFGGEGTGGQSFFDYDWKIGEKVQFFVKAKVMNPTTTRYTGFFYDNNRKQWQLMTEFQTITKGERLGNGLYSFVEDFRRNYESTKITRTANYTNGWAAGKSGDWKPMLNSRFTADPTPSKHIDAGPIAKGFFLKTGGETEMSTSMLWSSMKRDDQNDKLPKGLPITK